MVNLWIIYAESMVSGILMVTLKNLKAHFSPPLWIHSWHPSESKFESPEWDPQTAVPRFSGDQGWGNIGKDIICDLYEIHDDLDGLFGIYIGTIYVHLRFMMVLCCFFDGFMLLKSDVLMHLIHGNTAWLNLSMICILSFLICSFGPSCGWVHWKTLRFSCTSEVYQLRIPKSAQDLLCGIKLTKSGIWWLMGNTTNHHTGQSKWLPKVPIKLYDQKWNGNESGYSFFKTDG